MSAQIVFHEIKGNLFEAPADFALAHCVTTNMSMAAGIAREFKSRFGRVQELKDQKVTVGGVAVIKHETRYIYYLVTKDNAYKKPTYDDLKSSLVAMKNHMVTNQVAKLAIPQIGCGIDKLEWAKVKQILHDVFEGETVEVTVYSL
ncbi:ADP-ribose glycohydrolase OARD1-like [Sitodiplosis mosellana]|uniref:ADP-ribose glycohydrolase OARD1-like n=1 Tax=Sitodiplosis mosellana TaxID=263140 RepID=UPI002444F263|nr:ADP-ribose glycohydrolase OARD1-like [Sitodiplosis mosellana]